MFPPPCHPWPCAGTRTCVDCTSILDVIEIISFILQQFWNFDHCTDAPKFPEVMSQKLISRTYFSNTAYFKVLKNCSLTLVSILAVLLLMPGYTDIDSLFQTPLPPIQRGIQRCNCSFIWTGKNKKIDLDKKHRKKKKATLHKMANLDHCAMLHMTITQYRGGWWRGE